VKHDGNFTLLNPAYAIELTDEKTGHSIIAYFNDSEMSYVVEKIIQLHQKDVNDLTEWFRILKSADETDNRRDVI